MSSNNKPNHHIPSTLNITSICIQKMCCLSYKLIVSYLINALECKSTLEAAFHTFKTENKLYNLRDLVKLAPFNRFKPSSRVSCWPFQGGTSFVDLLCFLFCLVFAMSLCASVYMCFVVTCWERADLLALVCGV